MFNLIYKDLFIQKKYMKTLIINILLCYIVIAFINTSAAYIVNPFLITLSFFMYACGFGDKNDADVMLISLPVCRRDIILSKYLSSIIFLLAGILITLLLSSLLMISGIKMLSRPFNVIDVIITITSAMVYIALYLPLFFNSGYLKSQHIGSFIMVGALTLLIVMSMATTFVNNGTAKKYIMDMVSQPHFNIIFSAFSIILASAAFIISMTISIKLYSRREF